MEENNFQNEKLSIKNLLFTKAIPNYKIPIPTEGRPIFGCTDCGDRFIIKSSYEYHINRKSLKITYLCRHCNMGKIFFNRCNLLSHIRSHAFKTATISINDLKIEPLPLTFFNFQNQSSQTEAQTVLSNCSATQDNSEVQDEEHIVQDITYYGCFDCNQNIYSSGIIYRDRGKHYAQFTKNLYSCPVCLLTLSTECALRAHLRIHLREPPFFCPDCGSGLSNEAVVYPFSHDCESFKMMRATAKLKCLLHRCNKFFHPTETNKHLRTCHLKQVYKCPACSVACYKLANMQKHLKSHNSRKLKPIDYLQCEMCPGRLVIISQIEKHLKSHENDFVCTIYPCWTCGATYKLAKSLIQHQITKHRDTRINNALRKKLNESVVPEQNKSTKTLFRKSQKCGKCHKNITCGPSIKTCVCTKNSQSQIVCNLCKDRITEDWIIIKKHYAEYHKQHLCVDPKIFLNKINVKKFRGVSTATKRKKVNQRVTSKIPTLQNITKNCQILGSNNNLESSLEINNLICNKCESQFENKQMLEYHIVSHRDPFMAYQCLECGESFIAKPSFSTHLLLKHGINDVTNYINEKKCYSEESLHLQKSCNIEVNNPVLENQCNICREQFCNSTEFEKHFRVHGMAFLMKNTNKAKSPEKLEVKNEN